MTTSTETDQERRLRLAMVDALWQLEHDYPAGAAAILRGALPSRVSSDVPSMTRAKWRQ